MKTSPPMENLTVSILGVEDNGRELMSLETLSRDPRENHY